MKLFYTSIKQIRETLLMSRSIRCPECRQVGFMNRPRRTIKNKTLPNPVTIAFRLDSLFRQVT